MFYTVAFLASPGRVLSELLVGSELIYELQGVYAHAVCLTDDELKLMAQRGSSIAHCPLSNMFFADRLLRWALCLVFYLKPVLIPPNDHLSGQMLFDA